MKLKKRNFINIIDRLSQAFKHSEQGSKNSQAIRENGSWHYIPFNTQAFISALEIVDIKLRGKDNLTFVDYGCGIGATLSIAASMGFSAVGYEINEDLFCIACMNFTFSNGYNEYGHVEVNKADLESESVYKNKQYDVVYFYCPFNSNRKEDSFELKALDTVKIGGYLICPLPSRCPEAWNKLENSNYYSEYNELIRKLKNFEKVEHHIFKRIK